jgi:hypothetical protein
MFNLEQSIVEWRQQMLAAGIKTPVPLEELESHLRDDIEQQMESGINVQRAFEDAIQQIGKANMLKNEFEKVAGTKQASILKRTQIIFAACLGAYSMTGVTFLLFNPELTSVQRMSVLAAVAVMNMLAGIGLLLGHRFFPAILNQRMRGVICFSGCALLVLWLVTFCYVVLPRVDFTVGQLVVAVLWATMAPTGVLFGFIGGLEKAAWKKTAMAAS